VEPAFTLIELLIVVAIIAILAAIAVPNFLEAQTRAKVSRAQADMRALATAVETYMVDTNRAPRTLDYLTSPIAYIATLPKDPFRLVSGGQNKNGGGFRNQPFSYDFTAGKTAGAWKNAHAAGYLWWVYSWGPSRDARDPSSPTNNLMPQSVVINKDGNGGYVYEPSNGTISRGILMRTNKGIFTGPTN